MHDTCHGTPKLYEVFDKDFFIGAAVNTSTIKSHDELLKHHFNSITAENEMKFENVHPAENKYTFDQADQIVAFANDQGKNIRGHTLVWHNQTPAWVFENEEGTNISRSMLLERMASHMESIIGRYKGKVYSWDVVNEAVSDKSGEFLRPSPWLKTIGEDYIAKAFEYARQIDPDTLLFYNDYNEFVPEKRDKIYRLVKSIVDKDIPIDGIGLQGHWNLEFPSIDLIRRGIEKYASLGLQLHITELDISVFSHDDKRTDVKQPSEDMLIRQAERYQEIFSLFKEYRDHLTSVTFWGVADDDTWLDNFPVRGRKNWPFLFDELHQPKQSFWEIVKLARQAAER
ncbi:endo-1,4-beta-xylanase [Evansella caseinilytica]|uniref:Beta-xylanase n=1 Tax=Evansella caseinilytica TaxID=1503961 RepID=A0A1H3NTF3_9BACI|nr:endo-1,4-beta-xylanase [Evansella caseinilytica]SDY92181.1 endo-1,4-beta-xylanase [Evansella caseinilytica]